MNQNLRPINPFPPKVVIRKLVHQIPRHFLSHEPLNSDMLEIRKGNSLRVLFTENLTQILYVQYFRGNVYVVYSVIQQIVLSQFVALIKWEICYRFNLC